MLRWVFIVFLITWMCSCNTRTNHNEEALKSFVSIEIDTTLAKLSTLQSVISEKKDLVDIKQAFLSCRIHYKRLEPIVEYYFQGLSRRINGPALPEVKVEDSQVWPPHGLQVIEQLIYANEQDSSLLLVNNEIDLLKIDFQFIKRSLIDIGINERHVHELLQHECIRIASLGISGFDTPLSNHVLEETVSALFGMQEIASVYYADREIKENSELSIQYLKKINSNDTDWDRLGFISKFLIPLSDKISKHNPHTDTLFNQAFKGNLRDFLTGKGLNTDFYSGYAEAFSNASKVRLGEQLFYDTQLSKSNTISCGTCHQSEKYFTDGKVVADNLVHGGTLQRNTPTLYYAAFQNKQFYDMRVTAIEDQIEAVINNTNEFNSNGKQVRSYVSNSEKYKDLFKKAFINADTINDYMIRNAIAAYVRSQNPFQSSLDHYFRGNESALSQEQKKGFSIFMGKAKCGTCHFLPVFNGTVPPWMTQTESEVIGVPAKAEWKNASIDGDSGRYRINAIPDLLFAFKTPTLRNIFHTAPYMHNGVYQSLDEVITFYNKGGGTGIGIKLHNQTLPFDSLSLSNTEKKALIQFLSGLSDTGR
jgi:cytochrome c peroxidase